MTTGTASQRLSAAPNDGTTIATWDAGETENGFVTVLMLKPNV